MKRIVALALILPASIVLTMAVSPPSQIHYQGVLRDASDVPLNGEYNMTFRFWSYSTGGDEILRDRHLAWDGLAVSVRDGLFGVALGGGVMQDGSGPGMYTSLRAVFRDYQQVWLEIDVGGETLDPRVRILASAYALNADHLDGNSSDWFLDRSSSAQTKDGPLTLNASEVAAFGIDATGLTGGAHFQDADDTGETYLADSNRGIRAYGTEAGGYFLDTDGSGDTFIARDHRGVDAWGQEVGGYFRDSNSSGRAWAAYGELGIAAYGDDAAGYFEETGDLGWGSAWIAHDGYGVEGHGTRGVVGYGSEMGGYFEDSSSLASGYARIAYEDIGVSGYGDDAGGYFKDLQNSSEAWIGRNYLGIHAIGGTAGALFQDSDGSGYAHIAYGNTGVSAKGDFAGGVFEDLDSTGKAYLGYGDRGIDASGSEVGGHFSDEFGLVEVRIADGATELGIDARGRGGGAYFENTWGTPWAYVAYRSRGVWAEAAETGGHFTGDDEGVYARDGTSGVYGYLGTAAYSTAGNGVKGFLQNHPYDPERIVAYASLEGDEAGTYTRGTARLSGGAARIDLGETFRWVTNPDIGLTAQITPRGPCGGLYVASLSTTELVVREMNGGGSNARFDYTVFGLRIGFEELGIVRPKRREAYIPSMTEQLATYDRIPELRRYTALDRFRTMSGAVGAGYDIDLSASLALRDAVTAFDPAVHGPLREAPPRPGGNRLAVEGGEPVDPTGRPAPPEPTGGTDDEIDSRDAISTAAGRSVGADADPREAEAGTVARVPTAEPVQAGDVLVLDRARPGSLRRGSVMSDRAVAGVAWADTDPDGTTLVGVAGVFACKVDASYGAIRVGDVLAVSPTPGHAMLALDAQPGSVLGKAAGALETGTGTIEVLITLR